MLTKDWLNLTHFILNQITNELEEIEITIEEKLSIHNSES